jgi:hypothetical protein
MAAGVAAPDASALASVLSGKEEFHVNAEELKRKIRNFPAALLSERIAR